MQADGILVGAVRVDSAMRDLDSSARIDVAYAAYRWLERGGGEGDVMDQLSAPPVGLGRITHCLTPCTLSLQPDALIVVLSDGGRVEMRRGRISVATVAPDEPRRLVLVGRLTSCSLSLGQGVVRAAIVIQFPFKETPTHLTNLIKGENKKRLDQLSERRPSDGIHWHQQGCHDKSASWQRSAPELSVSDEGSPFVTPSEELRPKTSKQDQSKVSLSLLHSTSSSSFMYDVFTNASTKYHTSSYEDLSCASVPCDEPHIRPQSEARYYKESSVKLRGSCQFDQRNIYTNFDLRAEPLIMGQQQLSSDTNPPLCSQTQDSLNQERPCSEGGYIDMGDFATPKPMNKERSCSDNGYLDMSGLQIQKPLNQERSCSDSGYLDMNSLSTEKPQKLTRPCSDSGYLDMSGSSTSKPLNQEIQCFTSGYLDVSGLQIQKPLKEGSHSDSGYHDYDVSSEPESQANMQDTPCDPRVARLKEDEEQHIIRLETLKKSLETIADGSRLLAAVDRVYEFHRLVFRWEVQRASTTRQLAEAFVDKCNRFNVYKDFLVEQSKCLHQASLIPLRDQLLGVMTHIQNYKYALTSMQTQEPNEPLFQRALDVLHSSVASANTQLIFEDISECPLSPHEYGPALRTGWIHLTEEGSLRSRELFAILTESHFILAKKLLQHGRKIFYASILMDSVCLKVYDEGKCLKIKGSKSTKDGGVSSKRAYHIRTNSSVEAKAWVGTIRGILQRQADTIKARPDFFRPLITAL